MFCYQTFLLKQLIILDNSPSLRDENLDQIVFFLAFFLFYKISQTGEKSNKEASSALYRVQINL